MYFILSKILLIVLITDIGTICKMTRFLLYIAMIAYSASAFVIPDAPIVTAPPAIVVSTNAIQDQAPRTSPLQDGVRNYVASSFEESTTMTLSLKDRPPPPTKEELAAKKRNFNLWFWTEF